MLRKRLKGLLAFSLAFYLMFGNGIQVLAEEYDIATIKQKTEEETTIINPGAIIKYYYEVVSGAVTSKSTIEINDIPQALSMNDTSTSGQKVGSYQVSERLEVLAEAGDVYGTLKLRSVQKFDIVAKPDLDQAGSVTGGGTYEEGTEITVTATPNSGYQFSDWKENNQSVSTDSSYTFEVSGSRNLVAIFNAVPKYDIKVEADSAEGGSVTGGGTYEEGMEITVTATPNSNYEFAGWKENGQTVSEDKNYTFTVNGERELVGVFEKPRNNSGNSPSQEEPVPEKPNNSGNSPSQGGGVPEKPNNSGNSPSQEEPVPGKPNNSGNSPSQEEPVPGKPIVPEDKPQTQGPDPQTPERQEAPVSSSTGGSHIHTLKWEIVIEPTETTDGRSEYRCECGHVEAAQPISFFRVIIMRIIKAIEEAPQNGTVVVDNKFLRCLTDEIVAALHKRSDVNLEVRFVEQEVNYKFLIPAGRAPMEEEEWFGYFYLGGRYGWIQ